MKMIIEHDHANTNGIWMCHVCQNYSLDCKFKCTGITNIMFRLWRGGPVVHFYNRYHRN